MVMRTSVVSMMLSAALLLTQPLQAATSCDTNSDDALNVLDVVALVNAVLGLGSIACPGDCDPEPTADLSTGQVYIVLHCDPHGEEVCENEDASQWDRLVQAVAAADKRGHKLTLLMSADWVGCIQGNADRFELLKYWVLSGHQLGYHHHDCSHPSPGGYRADGIPGCMTVPSCPGCNATHCATCQNTLKGTAADAYASVKALGEALVAAGVPQDVATVNTANMGPNNWCITDPETGATTGICFRQYEWDASLIWGTETIANNPVDTSEETTFLTSPHCRQYSDGTTVFNVLETGHAQLAVSNFIVTQADNTYEAVEADLMVMASGALDGMVANMGIVFHPQEYTAEHLRDDDSGFDNDKDYIDAIMDLLVDHGHVSVTVRDVMGAQSITCP